MLTTDTTASRLATLRTIAWFCVVEHNKNIGVVLSSSERSKKFKADLMEVLKEIPNWMLQLESYGGNRVRTAANVSILLINSPNSTRGLTLDHLFFADDINGSKKNDYASAIIPAMRGRGFNFFNEEVTNG